jgi:serralysin
VQYDHEHMHHFLLQKFYRYKGLHHYFRPLVIIIFFFWQLSASSGVLQKDKQWPQNQILNVVFLDGKHELKTLVKHTASKWLENTNLSFNFYDKITDAPIETHIRVSFLLQSGSRLGDHKDYLSKLATMNLFDLANGKLSQEGEKRLVLHEFGHALGFIHEYRSPYWPYSQSIIDKIQQDCMPKMMRIGYSKSEASSRCQIVNQPINKKLVESTAFDEFSVMNYPVTITLSNGQDKTIRAHSALSYLDKYAIQLWYPSAQ